MDTQTCSICLNEILDRHLPITLSCNHRFHFTCFKNYSLKTGGNFFIDCPNCRQLNHHLEFPFQDNYTKNIKSICHSNVGNVRCPCTTLQGLKCKKKSYLLNYGKCQFHGEILPKSKHEPMSRYIFHLLQCGLKSWSTKIYLIDFVKKLIIKYPDKINTLDDIYHYLFIFLADSKKHNIVNCYHDKSILYNYYDLELPPKGWVEFCIEKKCLF